MEQTFNQLRTQSTIITDCFNFSCAVGSDNISINDLLSTKQALLQSKTTNTFQEPVKEMYIALIDAIVRYKTTK